MRDVRFTIRSATAAGMVAAFTLAGQAVASTAASAAQATPRTPAATVTTHVAARPDGGPGTWTQVTATTSDIADVGLARGADGVLHVLWEKGTIAGHEQILDTQIGPGGTAHPATVIVGGQQEASFPDATATPSGLDVFWNGVGSGKAPLPEGIFEATRPVRGGHWSLAGHVPETLPSTNVSAATASDGRPWVAFTASFDMSLVHLGQRQDNVATRCCLDEQGIATDGVTGTSYVAYESLISNAGGIFVQRLSNTGVAGKALRLAGSETGGNVFPINQRAGITGRGHGRAGVYVSYAVGYPSPRSLDVYRIGASKPVAIATFGTSGEQLQGSTITAGPDGRLWDAWLDGHGSTPQLFVRATNPGATAWGRTVHVPLPSGTQFVWQVYASAQAGRIDLVVLLTRHGHIADYATQSLLPPPPKKTAATPVAATLTAAKGPSWHVTKSVTAPKNGVFTALAATGKTTAWAFDSSGNSSAEPIAWTLRNGVWTKAPFPGKNNETVLNAAATSPKDVWAFTEGFTLQNIVSRVLHWNGASWKVVKTFSDVISEGAEVAPNDVWVFGEGQQNSAFYYNGHTWTFEGGAVDGGSVLAPNNAWGFTGTFVEHWPGHKWVATNVASLLPKKTALNNPHVTGILALASNNVYAVGQGMDPGGCGPTVILHFNGQVWKKVAQGKFGCGPITQMLTSDGAGGLWLPMPDINAFPSYLVHYSGGKLTEATLPGGFLHYNIEGVAHFPGTTRELAGGYTHPVGNPGAGQAAVILQYS